MNLQSRELAKHTLWKMIHEADQAFTPDNTSRVSKDIRTGDSTIRITVLLGGTFFRMVIGNMVFIGRDRIERAIDHLAEII
jgi:hypothetical protein